MFRNGCESASSPRKAVSISGDCLNPYTLSVRAVYNESDSVSRWLMRKQEDDFRSRDDFGVPRALPRGCSMNVIEAALRDIGRK